MTSIVAEAQYVESYNNRDLKRVFTSTGTDSILDIQEGQYVLYYGAVAVNLYNDLGGDLMLAWGLDGGCDDQLIHRWNSVRTSKAFIDEEGDIIVKKIKQLLEDHVKPAVEMDGGNIAFKSFDNGIVTLIMQGACSGCPSSSATLKDGIEAMLKRMVPQVTEVVAEAG